MTHAICQECKEEFDYELKVGYPRKYCFDCSAAKAASFKAKETPLDVPVVRPEDSGFTKEAIEGAKRIAEIKPRSGFNTTTIKEPTGEYQSLVYNKTLSANSYEVGKSGDRFKLYFETVEELKAKIAELIAAGFMTEEIDFEKEAKDAFNGK